MDRQDFYFEQIVTQADLDEAFDSAEAADHALQADNGYTGIAQGLGVAQAFPTPDLTVGIAAGVAYDPDGQRVYVASAASLDISVDSNAVPTTVANPGNEKWLSVFVAFDRTLSEPRVDGNGVPLLYRRDEAFQFIVDQGAEAAAGLPAVYTATLSETYGLVNGQTLEVVIDNTAPQTVTFNTGDFADIANATAAEVALVLTAQLTGATGADNGGFVELTSQMTGVSASLKVVGGTAAAVFGFPAVASTGSGGPSRPALRADAILLADVLLRNGTAQVFDAPGNGGASDGVIDLVTRRQWVFVVTGTQYVIRAGTITNFATQLSGVINSHINNTGASHPATAIDFDPSAVPAAWTNLKLATEVQAAIDGVHADISETTLGSAGATLVGHNGGAGVDVVGVTNTSAALLALDANKGSRGNVNTWTAVNTFNAQTNLANAVMTTGRVTGLLNIDGAEFTHEPVDYAGNPWGFTDGGVTTARVQYLGDALQHTLTGGASSAEIVLFDGGDPSPAAVFGMVEGNVIAFDDTGTAGSEWSFRAVFYLPSGAAAVVVSDAVVDTALDVNGGVTNLGSIPAISPGTTDGTLALTLLWTANLGAKRNIAATWRVSYFGRTQ